MADFRKWLFALAVVVLIAGLSTPASAQATTPVCSSQVATNYLARAEGYTEQVGDLVVTCQGGIPTAAGTPVPQADVTVTLSQNVTSRITANTQGYNFLEALLIIDEPNSPNNDPVGGSPNPILNCGSVGAPDQTGVGQSGPGVCEIISAGPTAGNSSPGTYNGAVVTNAACNNGATPPVTLTGAAAAACTGHPNVFQARQTGSPNVIVFHGVPLDPPGTGTRVLRFTNIRVNANGAGVAQANQTSEITESIASAGNSSLQIAVQAQAVATVEKGLTASNLVSNTTFAQCIGQASNVKSSTVFGSSSTCGGSSCNGSANTFGTTGYGTPTVRFTEGFASAWKVKNLSYTIANGTYTAGIGGENPYIYNSTTNPISTPVDVTQNIPGTSFFTESGFENIPLGTSTTVAQNAATYPPLGFGINVINGTLPGYYPFTNTAASGTGISAAGVANQGTRLALSLNNIPNGVTLYVTPVIFLYRQGVTYNGTPVDANAGATGVMVLTTTASDGSGNFSPPSGITGLGTGASPYGPVQAVTVSNGSALIVYEILFTDPFSLEYADVPVLLSYSTNLSANAPIGLPQPNVVATAAGGFAPFYSTAAATQASGSLPVPRFQFTGTAAGLFGIVKCNCNLLFPYVTQAPGYDTGIAIANTTMDPYGTTNQFGGVQFWYYGTLSNGGAAPGTQCTNTASPGTCPGTTTVAAGQVLTYTLYNGSAAWGLDQRGQGFTGYLIAQTQFQYCHAFAFIGALGGGPMSTTTNGLSEGYLALILDAGTFVRGSVQGESLGQ